MIKPISFGAKHLQNTQIKEFMFDKQASVVEIEFDNDKDKDAMNEAADSWTGNAYGCRIVDKLDYRNTPFAKAENWKIYALTTQTDDFKNLDSSKILGMMATSQKNDEDALTVDYIQVKPSTKHGKLCRKFKKVGTALIEYLQTEHNYIKLDSVSWAKTFYEKLGFIPKKELTHGCIMEWMKNDTELTNSTANDVKKKF